MCSKLIVKTRILCFLRSSWYFIVEFRFFFSHEFRLVWVSKESLDSLTSSWSQIHWLKCFSAELIAALLKCFVFTVRFEQVNVESRGHSKITSPQKCQFLETTPPLLTKVQLLPWWEKQMKNKNIFIIFVVVMSLFACTHSPLYHFLPLILGLPIPVIFLNGPLVFSLSNLKI